MMRIFYLIILTIFNFSFALSAYAQRYALVIGNSDYAIGALKNPVNDASDMAGLLEKKGFQVQKLTNADEKQMDSAIRQFTNQLHQKNAVGLFYYAGHGVEVGGRNYLIPIGANIENENDVKYESVDAGRVMDGMESAGNNLNIVILDACRNNPFARSFRAASRGLARMDAAKGSLVLYATSPGEVASDGGGRNGLFTQHLMVSIDEPTFRVEDVFKQTAKRVFQATGGKQTPWQSGVIIDDFYFTINAQNTEAKTIQAPTLNTKQEEIEFWNSIKNSQNVAYFKAYLDEYGEKGKFVRIAKIKLNEIYLAKDVSQKDAEEKERKRRESSDAAKKLVAEQAEKLSAIEQRLKEIEALKKKSSFDLKQKTPYTYQPPTKILIKFNKGYASPKIVLKGKLTTIRSDYSLVLPENTNQVNVTYQWVLKKDGKILTQSNPGTRSKTAGGHNVTQPITVPRDAIPGTYIVETKLSSGNSYDINEVAFVVR